MTLAMMIADPQQMTPKLLDQWVKITTYYVIADVFSNLAVKTPHALAKMKKWTTSKDEFVGQAGWNLLAHLAMKDDSLTDKFFDPYLKTIRTDIHNRKNRTRHAMNGALIAIGIRNAALEKKAIAISRAIGKVEVDHGETSCKTPEAEPYIKKTLARLAARDAKRAAKAKR
jgi:3-methyladenine DNA glycosylase AlkD